jgi:hypothetical protein
MQANDIMQFLDSTVALGIAVWVIQLGIRQLNHMQTQNSAMVNQVLTQQQQNNDALMGLVSTLCINPATPSSPPPDEKKRGGP